MHLEKGEHRFRHRGHVQVHLLTSGANTNISRVEWYLLRWILQVNFKYLPTGPTPELVKGDANFHPEMPPAGLHPT